MVAALATALGLMLVIEGALPFFAPAQWREVLRRICGLADGQIRFLGLSMMAVGLLVLAFSR
jgi:uncharacterized protein YjeT (DUF2065 family)